MKWAYHTATGYAVGAIAARGLQPSDQSVKRRGTPVLFFTEDAAGAYRYFIDREDPILLRFPWPADARQDHDEWLSALYVPSRMIYAYTGRALDRIADAYYLADVEDRFAVLAKQRPDLSEKVERARAWTPLDQVVG